MELLESTDGSIESSDSTKLYYVKDIFNKPKAIIVIVHGFGEQLGRYKCEKNRFIEYGCCVDRFDNRRHGRSGGEKGYINTSR
ncbi:alpha/beta hydrolase [Maledivibacter halophilus]|uniref:Lysophospholipase n=1 Tax=Maledivibacter halophilus TaxID=36842 RepID=A0A1T5MEE4_9FIRM|nr:alpha/beta hydrolase [Maledivibacter halophilus]SKC86453.1 Lysophospholipase [Maledivibacter halophilus]